MAPSSGHAYHPSNGSSSSDRRYSAANGKAAAVAARHDRTPNTPKKESGGREKAVQDPGLRDYVRVSFAFPGGSLNVLGNALTGLSIASRRMSR